MLGVNVWRRVVGVDRATVIEAVEVGQVVDRAWSTTTVRCALRRLRHTFLSAKLRLAVEVTFSPPLATPLGVPTHAVMRLLGCAGAPTRA